LACHLQIDADPDSVPDPAYHFDANPEFIPDADPDYQNDADTDVDPDPQHWLQLY
jgi:hypothetical protein